MSIEPINALQTFIHQRNYYIVYPKMEQPALNHI